MFFQIKTSQCCNCRQDQSTMTTSMHPGHLADRFALGAQIAPCGQAVIRMHPVCQDRLKPAKGWITNDVPAFAITHRRNRYKNDPC